MLPLFGSKESNLDFVQAQATVILRDLEMSLPAPDANLEVSILNTCRSPARLSFWNQGVRYESSRFENSTEVDQNLARLWIGNLFGPCFLNKSFPWKNSPIRTLT